MNERILEMMRETLRITLATRLGAEWKQQNEGQPTPKAYDEFSIKFNHELVTRMGRELARNMAQGLVEIVDMAQAYCHNTHDQVAPGQGCKVEHCPFFIDPEDACTQR